MRSTGKAPEWAERVRAVRAGRTQASFAKLIGVSQVAVSRWEAGKDEPSASACWTISRIASGANQHYFTRLFRAKHIAEERSTPTNNAELVNAIIACGDVAAGMLLLNEYLDHKGVLDAVLTSPNRPTRTEWREARDKLATLLDQMRRVINQTSAIQRGI